MSKAINIENLRQFAQEFWTKIKGKLATVATTGSYNDLSNKPTIVNPGTLNTNNTTAQTASASESFSGTIALHKVSKTGNYNDLLNKPTIPQGTVTGIKMNGESKGTSGVVDLGTVLTSFTETQLSKGSTTGGGNAITDISVSNHTITLTKGLSFSLDTHTHSNITTEGDNRNTNTTPDDYENTIAFRGLKYNGSIGAPSTDSYSYLVGLRGWTDSSGGNSHEIAFNNTGMYWRTGATTSWDSWKKVALNGEPQPASDVYSWAKASSKPSYTASEVGALPTGTTLDNIADGSTRKLSNYATQASLNSHTGDTTVHITSTERSNWNNKVSNVQADWNATSGLAQILNKPTIPTVNNATLTVKQNGSSVGTFTANAASNVTIDLGTVLTSHQDITGKENTSNKVVSITSSSTDSQYPSSKAVYNAIEGAKSYADSAVANIDNETWTFELENGSTVTRTVLLA